MALRQAEQEHLARPEVGLPEAVVVGAVPLAPGGRAEGAEYLTNGEWRRVQMTKVDYENRNAYIES